MQVGQIKTLRTQSLQQVLKLAEALDRRAPLKTSGATWQWQDPRGYTHFKRSSSYGTERAPALLMGAVGIAGFAYWSSLQDIPYTHRRHSIWLSIDMEKSMGVAAFGQLKAQAEHNGTLLSPQHPSVRRVRRIGLAIVDMALQCKGGGFMRHMQNLDWEFVVIMRPDPNAMVLPGGKVIVHSGLLEAMRADDEIAAVLGHEVAHVVARHVAEKLSRAQIFELLRVLIFWTVGIPIPSGALQLAVFLPNSRKLETEADMIGMQIAAQSCYDPAASVHVFRKLGEIERRTAAGSIPGFLRTHPLTEARVARVQAEVAGARQTFELSGCTARRGALAEAFS